MDLVGLKDKKIKIGTVMTGNRAVNNVPRLLHIKKVVEKSTTIRQQW